MRAFLPWLVALAGCAFDVTGTGGGANDDPAPAVDAAPMPAESDAASDPPPDAAPGQPFGADCQDDGDCESNMCVKFHGNERCTMPCTPMTTCPGTSTCHGRVCEPPRS